MDHTASSLSERQHAGMAALYTFDVDGNYHRPAETGQDRTKSVLGPASGLGANDHNIHNICADHGFHLKLLAWKALGKSTR